MRTFYVYILASRSRVLYIGITNDLARRLAEHRSGSWSGFASTYKVTRLVHFEEYSEPLAAITREKQLKNWRRDKKIALIEAGNPSWRDHAGEVLGGPSDGGR
jgi:putative endonuclease